MKLFHIEAIPENGFVEALGEAEAKDKAWRHFQACYGNDFQILDIVDVTELNFPSRTIDRYKLV